MSRRSAFLAMLLVVLISSTAHAQFVSSVNWGYLYAQKVVLNNSLSDLEGKGTFTNLDVDVGYMVNDRVGIHVGAGGFKTESTFIIAGQSGSLEAQNVSIPFFVRAFMHDSAQKARAFFEVGPSLNVQEFDVSGGGQSIGGSEEKLGITVGIGVVGKLGSGKLKLIPKARYAWVQKQGDFDASSFLVTLGVGFGSL